MSSVIAWPGSLLPGAHQLTLPLAVDGTLYTEPKIVATDTAGYLQADAKANGLQNGQLVLPPIDNPPAEVEFVTSSIYAFAQVAKSTLSISIPAGPDPVTGLTLQAGDLIEIMGSTQENSGLDPGDMTCEPGWTLRQSTLSAAAYKPHITKFYKFAIGNEGGTTVDLDIPTGVWPGGVWTHGACQIFRGVDPEQPYDLPAPMPYAIGSTGSNPNPPAVMVQTEGAMVTTNVVGNFAGSGFPANVSPFYAETVNAAPQERAFVNCHKISGVGQADPWSYAWQVQNWMAITDVLKPRGGSVKMLLLVAVGDQQATAGLTAVDAPSVAARNETQTLTALPGLGSFTLTFNGETTASIAANATATDVQAALEGLGGVTSVDVSVTGGALDVDPILVEFIGAYANTNLALMTASDPLLAVAQLVVGSTAEPFGLAGTINIPRAGGARQPQVHVWTIEVSSYVAGKVIDMRIAEYDNLHTWNAILLIGEDIDMAAISGATLRDRLLQPFSTSSFWNAPISDDAVYVPANIPSTVPGGGITALTADIRRLSFDQDIVFNDPNAAAQDVLQSTAGWSGVTGGQDRIDGAIVPDVVYATVPMDQTFDTVTNPQRLNTKGNHATSAVLADGNTIHQFNAFERSDATDVAVAFNHSPTEFLDGIGQRGGHGGSGLSSVGGTMRMGEWVPGGVIKHALKFDLWAAQALHWEAVNDGYRWPAIRSDGYADSLTDPRAYAGLVPECRMGALLALLPTFNVAALTHEPARILAQALMDYGMYCVDDTTGNRVSLCAEWGPNGSVHDEFFGHWGFAPDIQFESNATWGDDIGAIFAALQVVDNNTETTVGGGTNGQPETSRRAPYALPLAPVGVPVPPGGTGSPLTFGTEVVGNSNIATFGAVTPPLEGSKVLAVATKGLGLEEWYPGGPGVTDPPSVPPGYTLAAESISDSQTLSVHLSPPLDDVSTTPGDSSWPGGIEKWSTGLIALRPLVSSMAAAGLPGVVDSADEGTWIEIAGAASRMNEILEFDLSSLGTDTVIISAALEFAHQSEVRNRLRATLAGIKTDGTPILADPKQDAYEPVPLNQVQTVLTGEWRELADNSSLMDYSRLGVQFLSTEIHPVLTSHRIFWVRALLEVEAGGPVIDTITGPATIGDPISWVYSSASGLAQSHYQVKVIAGANGDPDTAVTTTNVLEAPDGDVVFDSGKVVGPLDRSVSFESPWGKGTQTIAVRSWARLESGVEIRSKWKTQNHNLPGSAPSIPTAPVAPVFNELTGSVDLGFTTPVGAVRAFVIRSIDGGATWAITGDSPYTVAESTAVVLQDPSAPLGSQVLYKVAVDGGLMSEHSFVLQLSATEVDTTAESWFLQSPTTPALNRRILVASFSLTERRRTVVAEQPGSALVAHAPSLGDEIRLGLRTLTKAERDDLDALLLSPTALRLIDILGREWLVRPVNDEDHQMLRIGPLPEETTGLRDAHVRTVTFREVTR